MAFDPMVNGEIGGRLRKLREHRELTRERLAEYADISVQFLADIEMGRKGMTVQTLRKLATALHCSSDTIVFGNQVMKKNTEDSLRALFLSLSPKQVEQVEEILKLILKALPSDREADKDDEEAPESGSDRKYLCENA